MVIAMNYLHQKRIDHRDLKPHNILIFRDASIAKIADFGMAKFQLDDEIDKEEDVGTEDYLAPEAKDKEKGRIPFKSDMYSLGLILHFMIGKDLPSAS